MTTDSARPSLRDVEYRVFYRPHDNPLETFYLPTLAASVHYDRSTGYFRSSALAAAAAGIVRLIQNDGRMRLLVGVVRRPCQRRGKERREGRPALHGPYLRQGTLDFFL